MLWTIGQGVRQKFVWIRWSLLLQNTSWWMILDQLYKSVGYISLLICHVPWFVGILGGRGVRSDNGPAFTGSSCNQVDGFLFPLVQGVRRVSDDKRLVDAQFFTQNKKMSSFLCFCEPKTFIQWIKNWSYINCKLKQHYNCILFFNLTIV